MNYYDTNYQTTVLPFNVQQNTGYVNVNPIDMIPTQFFVPNSVNVFTDASKQNNDNIVSIAAALTYTDMNWKTQIFRSEVVFIENATIFEGEAYSIQLGINLTKEYPNINRINLFNDSINVINEIRSYLIMPNVMNVVNQANDGNPLINTVAAICNSSIAIQIFHFKNHTRNVGYIYDTFMRNNHIPINTYDIIQCAGIMAMIDSDVEMSLRNRNVHF